MATYSIVTTAQQDRAITYYVSHGHAPNAEALIQQVVSHALADLLQGYQRDDDSAVGGALRNADATTRQQVKTLLGLS